MTVRLAGAAAVALTVLAVAAGCGRWHGDASCDFQSGRYHVNVTVERRKGAPEESVAKILASACDAARKQTGMVP